MKLFLDSSTNYLYLALYDGNKEISSMVRNGRNDHSETLVDVLKNFLLNSGKSVDDISSVYVGRGPGSYTGVRISGTVAKVLALVKNLKLYSFSTLDLLLASKLESDGLYVARIQAKKNHSYYKVAKVSSGKLIFESNDLFSCDDVLDNYKEYNFIEVSEELLKENNLAKKILDEKLYEEEDVFNYVPNYLRNEING